MVINKKQVIYRAAAGRLSIPPLWQTGRPQLQLVAAGEASITLQAARCRPKHRCTKHYIQRSHNALSAARLLLAGRLLVCKGLACTGQMLHLLQAPGSGGHEGAQPSVPLRRTHHRGEAFCHHSCLLQQPLLQLQGSPLRGGSSSRRLRRCCCCRPMSCVLHGRIRSCPRPAGSSSPWLRR